MSGPNGEGLPTHILITDELVQRALDAQDSALQDIEADEGEGVRSAVLEQRGMTAALSAVASDLFSAGMRAAIKLGAQTARDTSTEDSDTTREVGTGGGYELDANGQVQAAEDGGAEASGDLDQAGQEGVGPSPRTGWWKSPPTGDAERD